MKQISSLGMSIFSGILTALINNYIFFWVKQISSIDSSYFNNINSKSCQIYWVNLIYFHHWLDRLNQLYPLLILTIFIKWIILTSAVACPDLISPSYLLVQLPGVVTSIVYTSEVKSINFLFNNQTQTYRSN